MEDALGAGVDRFDASDRTRVRSVQRALRLDEAPAKEVLDTVARRAFMGFVTRARTKATGQGQGQHAGAKELKSLVFFSNVCVAPLLEDIKVRLLSCSMAVLSRPRLWGREPGRGGRGV